jgi:putative oxidoreductase
MGSKELHYGLLLLRVGTGVALATHGYPKLFGGEGKQPPRFIARVLGKNFPEAFERGGIASFSQVLEQLGTPSPKIAAYLAGLTEFSGGVALALGVATRLVTPAIIFNMGVATRKVHWQTGFYGPGGFELPSLYAVIAAALWFTGPGKYSVDHLIQRSSRARAIPPCPDIGVARVSRR